MDTDVNLMWPKKWASKSPWRLFAVAAEFCTVTPVICVTLVWDVLHVILLASIILRFSPVACFAGDALG